MVLSGPWFFGGLWQRALFAFFSAAGNLFPDPRSKSEPAGDGAGVEDWDLEYVQWFKEGREQGFNRLVQRHQDRVYNLCYRMLGDAGDAEEAAQEAFMKVHRGLKDFRAEAKFSTWLYRIAVNVSLNIRQSSRRRSLREAPDYDLESAADPAGGPEADLEARRQEAWVQRGIRSLPAEFRVPLVLRDIEGRDYEEIAEITGANLGTVRSRLHRAREKMRDFLAEEKT